MDRKCAECFWWDSDDGQDGECRVNPPQLLVGDPDAAHGHWPIVSREDWCRYFELAVQRVAGREEEPA